jgi:diguanylate cyclase (GGDEF)-like protein
MREPAPPIPMLAHSASNLLLHLLGLRGASLQRPAERRQHLLTAVSIGLPLSLGFSLFNLHTGFIVLAAIEALASLLLLAALWLVRRGEHAIDWAESVTLVWGGSVCCALVVFGGIEGSGALWIFAYPYLAFFLKPQGTAWLISLAWLSSCVLLLAAGDAIPAAWPYSDVYKVQMAGALLFATLVAAAFNLARARFAQQLEQRVAENTEKARAYLEELQYLATHDAVTALPNRAGLLQLLEGTLAACDPAREVVVAVSLRLERFPETINVIGEEASDLLARHIAGALALHLDADAVLGRTRVDEFVVFQRAERNPTTPDRVMTALHDIPLGFTIDELPVHVDHIVGCAVFPEHAAGADELLRRAEQAMMQARARRVSLSLYDDQLDQVFHRRTRLFGELREALARDALEVWFQPQHCLQSGRVVGAEALARWPRADGTFVSPGEFIPVAEQSGLIKPLSDLVLRRFFDAATSFHGRGMPLRCSVNLSARNLTDPDTLELLRQLLDRSGLPPAQIVVELTESSFADDPQHLMRTAHALRSMGVRQSIDDFGTGYSSLAYLRDLPVDELKIDQVFIRSLAEGSRSAPLVEAVIRLAHTLGLEVVAEGIEETATEQFLAARGCDTGQGFLYAPAMPANLFIDYVRSSTAREPRLPATSRFEG